jgi:hypothetical protein
MGLSAWKNWIPGETVTSAMLNDQIKNQGENLWKYQAAGDLEYATSGTELTRLPIGSNNQFMRVSSGAPSWQSFTTSMIPGASSSVCYGLKSKGGTVAFVDATGFVLQTVSTQNINYNTYTALVFNNETYDSDSVASTTQVVIPSSLYGLWHFSAGVHFSTGGNNTLREISIASYAAGVYTWHAQQSTMSTNGGVVSLNCSRTVLINATGLATLGVGVYSLDGSTVTAENFYFTGFKVA